MHLLLLAANSALGTPSSSHGSTAQANVHHLFLNTQAFDKMSGPRDSEVELTACRKTAKGKQRVTAVVLRDVGAAPKVARPGFEVASDKFGLRITGIADKTAVGESAEVEPDDIITMINDEFVSGMSMQEVWPLLWGDVGSDIDLTIRRLIGNTKSRIEVCAVRDYNIQQTIPKPPSAIMTKLASLSGKTSTPKKAPPKRNVAPGKKAAAVQQEAPVSKLAQRKKKSGVSMVVLGLLLAIIVLLPVSLHIWLMRNKGVGLRQFDFKRHGPILVDDMTIALKGASATAMNTTGKILKGGSEVALKKMSVAYQVIMCRRLCPLHCIFLPLAVALLCKDTDSCWSIRCVFLWLQPRFSSKVRADLCFAGDIAGNQVEK